MVCSESATVRVFGSERPILVHLVGRTAVCSECTPQAHVELFLHLPGASAIHPFSPRSPCWRIAATVVVWFMGRSLALRSEPNRVKVFESGGYYTWHQIAASERIDTRACWEDARAVCGYGRLW